MAATPVWITAYGASRAGATAMYLSSASSATLVQVMAYGKAPPGGGTPIWIARPSDAGATAARIVGYGTGGGGSGPTGSTWSTADASAATPPITLTNSNMTAAYTGAANWQSIRGSVSRTSGQYYVEFKCTVLPSAINFVVIGLGPAGMSLTSYPGGSANSCGQQLNNTYYATPGFSNGTGAATFITTLAVNDVVGLAVDFTAQTVCYLKNGVLITDLAHPQHTFVATTVGAQFPALAFHTSSGGTWTLQTTSTSQTYLPPPGFQAWDGGPVTPPASSTWSTADATTNGMTLSNGGMTVTSSGTNVYLSIRTTISKTSGKLYVEFKSATGGNTTDFVGLANAGFNIVDSLGDNPISCGQGTAGIGYAIGGGFVRNYTVSAPTLAANDVWAVAVDFTAGSVWVAQNNVWINGSNPGAGTLPVFSFTPATAGALFAGMSFYGVSGAWTLQPTAASQKYAPPAGFTAWDGGASTSGGLGTTFMLGVSSIG